MDHLALDMGLAFLEGFALIVSPCIWPVLPLVLSASAGEGRGRPFGVIAGFVLSFAGFAWASRGLIERLGLDPEVVKYGALVLLAFFGLVLLSSTLSQAFSAATGRLAQWGARRPLRGGWGGGLAAGALIGLVWTPCAGPVLAAVLVQVIRQSSDASSFFILSAFALGAALPMGGIALAGRAALEKVSFVRTYAQGIRRFFGLLILASAAFIASGLDPVALVGPAEGGGPMKNGAAQTLIHPLARPYMAPALVPGGAWINSPPLTLEALRGKVVLIDFWTYSCINCLRTLPYIAGWDQKYRDQGLVIIGVHAPEFAFEKKEENVRRAVGRYDLRYPVMQDNFLDTWVAYQNHYWPAHYLIARDGRVVYTHFGEGAYDETEHNIRVLLGASEKPAGQPVAEDSFDRGQTPETYLGAARAEALANGTAAPYVFPESLKRHRWALQGLWRRDGEKIISVAAGDSLRLRFKAKKVFLVLGTDQEAPIDVSLTLNGKPLGPAAGADAPGGTVTVKGNRLYELIHQESFQEGVLELRAQGPGLEAYAFTFGR